MNTWVDLSALASSATKLDGVAVELDETGTSVPTRIDGGEVGDVLLDMLAGAVGNSAELAEGLAAAAAKLRESAQAYQAADEASADSFRRYER
jgi:hypothetical protein